MSVQATRSSLPAGMTYEDERDGLVEAVKGGESAAWRIGLHWHNLVEYSLWKKAYPSAGALLQGELEQRGLDVPSASELSHRAAVAVAFPEKVAVRFGITRLYLALTYWGHKRKRDFSRTDPQDEEIEVPLPDGSKITKLLASCTVADLKAANAVFGGPNAQGLSAKDTALQSILQGALQTLVGSQGAGRLKLKRVAGRLVMNVALETPLDRFSSLLDALKALPIGKAKAKIRARLH